MRQRIEPAQLNELSTGQKEKLREWWKPGFTDHFLYEKDDGFKGCHIVEYYDCDGEIATLGNRTHCLRKTSCLPLLSIGQMIEILNRSFSGRISLCGIFCALGGPGGMAFKDNNLIKEDAEFGDGGDLCDNLWFAVKAIL